MDSLPGSVEHANLFATVNSFEVPDGFSINTKHSNRNRMLLQNDDTMQAILAFKNGGTTEQLAPKLAARHARAAAKELQGYSLTMTGTGKAAHLAAHAKAKVRGSKYVGIDEAALDEHATIKVSKTNSSSYFSNEGAKSSLSFKKHTFRLM